MKKVLIYSSEPGGVELLKSLQSFICKDVEILFLSGGTGGLRLRQNQHPFQEIDGTLDSFKNALTQFKPYAVVTSATSMLPLNPGESLLWRAARDLKIRSLGLLDQWQNYKLRFSTDGALIDSKPDFINAIDEIGRSEMMKLDFKERELVCLGHPYLDQFVSQTKVKVDVKSLSARKRILFVSEPIQEYFKSARGYDQFSAFEFLLDSLLERQSPAKFFLKIKMHPKETKSSDFERMCKAKQIQYEILEVLSSPESALLWADEVYGMTSIMLIQSYLLGLPTTSIQPHLTGEDPLVISRHGFIKRLGSEQVLEVKNPPYSLSYEFKKREFLKLILE